MVAILLGVLSGCDKVFHEPTIDTSTDERMKKTAQDVRNSLPEDERLKFDNALKIVAFSQIDMNDIFHKDAASTGNYENRMKDVLHGKNAKQVFAEAENIKLERDERQRKQAMAEIAELEKKRTAAEKAKDELKKFLVVRSRFTHEEQKYGLKQPIIELTVKNGTSAAVSRAYFEGTIASPGRSVPWHVDKFNYSISGGLEPGEEQSWSLAPDKFSDWGLIEAPADAVFTVTVQRIDGADGHSLYSTTDFTERDANRLTELKSRYGI
ncbi:hypothetical protein HG263_06310 [Pseudoalteromonas sp. JBTF-M23]|uniref:Uncharacterized protein n=1 Tax=Pseudoalteromonas caenipelagi TaxID=2726988 RepID=A0A849VC58_9GAMM|nr:hypothetical protein [Pseudoalteromonas caenipelagi]